MMLGEADVIVVGGGSAGCVVAARAMVEMRASAAGGSLDSAAVSLTAAGVTSSELGSASRAKISRPAEVCTVLVTTVSTVRPILPAP
jgi:thioredoxin reductase